MPLSTDPYTTVRIVPPADTDAERLRRLEQKLDRVLELLEWKGPVR